MIAHHIFQSLHNISQPMSIAEKKQNTEHQNQPIGNLFAPTRLKVKSTHTEELVIALCGPIGSPLHKVGDEIKIILERRFNYTCKIIKLSEIIEQHAGKAKNSSKFERIHDLINKGNKLRQDYEKSILADLAISNIASDRQKTKDISGIEHFESRRVCHVIDSIKNQEELEALRSVYREMLYFIGVFSPMPVRERNLENQGMSLGQVYQLIDRDSGEEFDHGQTVRETFPHADFFLRVDSESDRQLTSKLERFLNIIFGVEILTPSSGETAMYLASSAAGNAACLSRQVGAAITDEKGEIISVGWNDVPKADGNLYQYSPNEGSTMEYDKRCMHLDGGTCFNDFEKQQIAKDIAKALVDGDVIVKENTAKAVAVILNSKIKNLLEFSRSIHAEMHAIIMGSQMAGDRIKGGKLYCTTYPCHSCARHIIVSGIKEVYYIEPYRKSLALKLHADAITERESEREKVRILPFDGVAPSRYLNIFRMKPDSRKNSDGKRIRIDPQKALPIYEVSLESLPALEAIVVKNLVDKKLITVT